MLSAELRNPGVVTQSDSMVLAASTRCPHSLDNSGSQAAQLPFGNSHQVLRDQSIYVCAKAFWVSEARTRSFRRGSRFQSGLDLDWAAFFR